MESLSFRLARTHVGKPYPRRKPWSASLSGHITVSGCALQTSLIVILNQLAAECAGNPAAKVPWTVMQADSRPYIEREYLPRNVKLSEPSKMRQQDIDLLLDHWHTRREDRTGKKVFEFKAYQGSDKEPKERASQPEGLKTLRAGATYQRGRQPHRPQKQSNGPRSSTESSGTRSERSSGRDKSPGDREVDQDSEDSSGDDRDLDEDDPAEGSSRRPPAGRNR